MGRGTYDTTGVPKPKPPPRPRGYGEIQAGTDISNTSEIKSTIPDLVSGTDKSAERDSVVQGINNLQISGTTDGDNGTKDTQTSSVPTLRSSDT